MNFSFSMLSGGWIVKERLLYLEIFASKLYLATKLSKTVFRMTLNVF